MFNAPDGKKFKCWTNQDVTAFCYPNEEPSDDFLTSVWHPALGAYYYYYGLFALWEDENATTTYTVWFKGDNGSWMEPLKGQIVEKGKKATEPTEPKLHQFYRFEDWFYEFCGWYQDEDYTVPYDFNNPVYDNLIIYLKWRIYPAEKFKGVIASFEANGGSGEQTAIGVDKGEQLTLPECTFTAPENATFAGWQNGSNTYKPGDKIDMTGNMTFNAVWKYPVTINSVSCTVTAPIAGQKPDYIAAVPAGKGYLVDEDFTDGTWVNGVLWHNDTDNKDMTENDTFEEDKQYTVTVLLDSAAGYSFAESVSGKLNGENAEVIVYSDSSIGVYRTFTCQSSAMIGEANLDGKINIRDVTAIQRHIAEYNELTGRALLAADTDGDGEINIADATHLQKYLAEFDGIALGKQPTA